jgi:peptidoglycan/xylan/chitin deacetylase (PgdA/CDA1 family)
MHIGVHGYDHYWLGELSAEQMKQDVTKALEVMDEFIDSKHWAMNYPYGSYSPEVLAFVKSKGACVGVTTDVRVADLTKDPALELPRLDCNDFPPKSENYRSF